MMGKNLFRSVQRLNCTCMLCIQHKVLNKNWLQTKGRSFVKVTEKLRTQPIHISNTLYDQVKLFFRPLTLPQEPVYRRPRTSQYTGDNHLTAARSKHPSQQPSLAYAHSCHYNGRDTTFVHYLN